MAARTVTMIRVMLVGGVVGDRFNRRAVMMAAGLVRFAGQMVIGLLLLARRPETSGGCGPRSST